MNQKLGPFLGIVFFGLLLAGVLTGGSSPSASASGAKVLAFYTSHQTRIEIGGLLVVLSVVVGVIFFGMLRDYLRRSEASRGLTATAFGGVIIFALSGVLGSGTDWALTDSPKHLTPAAAQGLNLFNMDGTYAVSAAGAAILLIAYGMAILKSGLLPAWLGWVAMPLALCNLIPPIGIVGFVGTGLWVPAVSIALWLRLRAEGAPQATTPSELASAAG